MNPYPRKYFETSSINQHRIDPVASHATDWTLLSYGLLWTPSYSHHIISITSYHLYHKEYQLIMNRKVGLHDYTLILSVNGVMLQLSVNGVILPSSCLPPSQFPMIQNPDTDMDTPLNIHHAPIHPGGTPPPQLGQHHCYWTPDMMKQQDNPATTGYSSQ